VSELALLESQRRVFLARIDRIRAAADRQADSAALFQAVGGGWWNEESSATPPAATPR
jgi:outer membrane protein TolC